MEIDPAFDRVVEVDITNTDIYKSRVYASLGVSEFWRLNGREWKILCLVDGEYKERDRSPTFPIIEKTDLYQFLPFWMRSLLRQPFGNRFDSDCNHYSPYQSHWRLVKAWVPITNAEADGQRA